MPQTWAVIDGGAVVEAHDGHLPAPWWSFTKTVLAAAARGHTGGGPGSAIAVYRALQGGSSRTAAVFMTGEDPSPAEEKAFGLLKR